MARAKMTVTIGDHEALERHLNFARQKPRGLMGFARRDLTEQIVAEAREMQVVIVSQREDSGSIGA